MCDGRHDLGPSFSGYSTCNARVRHVFFGIVRDSVAGYRKNSPRSMALAARRPKFFTMQTRLVTTPWKIFKRWIKKKKKTEDMLKASKSERKSERKLERQWRDMEPEEQQKFWVEAPWPQSAESTLERYHPLAASSPLWAHALRDVEQWIQPQLTAKKTPVCHALYTRLPKPAGAPAKHRYGIVETRPLAKGATASVFDVCRFVSESAEPQCDYVVKVITHLGESTFAHSWGELVQELVLAHVAGLVNVGPQIHDAWFCHDENGQPRLFIIQEKVHGQPLDQWFFETYAPSYDEYLRRKRSQPHPLCQLLPQALDKMHALGVAHADLGGGWNILVVPEADDPTVVRALRIIDWGLAQTRADAQADALSNRQGFTRFAAAHGIEVSPPNVEQLQQEAEQEWQQLLGDEARSARNVLGLCTRDQTPTQYRAHRQTYEYRKASSRGA